MCGDIHDDEPGMAGLHSGHLEKVLELTTLDHGLVRELHDAMTDTLNPHLPVLPAFVALIESLDAGDFGVLGEHNLVRLPLSVIGANKVRYQNQMVFWLHDSMLMMRMSEITVAAIRKVLRPRGICVLFLCSCGVVLGRCENVRTYYGSEDHRRMEKLRSGTDAMNWPVVRVKTLDDIEVPTMDLHANGAEERLYARIEQLTHHASIVGGTDYGWLDVELAAHVAKANPVAAAA